jgi:hypothetical protein
METFYVGFCRTYVLKYVSSCEPVFIEVVTCSCIVFKINVDCVSEIKSLTAVVEGLKQGIFILHEYCVLVHGLI